MIGPSGQCENSGVARMIEIGTADDTRVDDFRDLSTADRRPDRPGGRGLVIAEGVVVVERLVASPYPVRALFGVRKRIEALSGTIAQLDVPAYIAEADVMAQVIGFHLNRGVLAVADRAPEVPAEKLVRSAKRIAVLEGIGDHENLGSLFRNAAALGIDGMLLGPGCSDPLYRRSVRVSMGHVLNVPFAPISDCTDALDMVRDHGFRIAALTPRAAATPLSHAELDQGPIALLLGSEGYGLSDQAIAQADLTVRIPMSDGIDSLNVATAAAVAFHAMSGTER